MKRKDTEYSVNSYKRMIEHIYFEAKEGIEDGDSMDDALHDMESMYDWRVLKSPDYPKLPKWAKDEITKEYNQTLKKLRENQ